MPYIRVPKLSGTHPLVLANAVQVKLRWSCNSIECLNVLGGRVGGGFANSQAHANSLSTAIGAAVASSGLQALLATTTSFQGVGIRDVRVAHQVEFASNAGFAAGLGANDPVPNQLAAVVTLRTALAGKSYRGRVYFSGADEDQNTPSGQIDAGFNTALVDFMTEVQAAMAAEGITLAVLSAPRYANLPPPADVQTWAGALTDVTGIETRDTQWDTQRRRKT